MSAPAELSGPHDVKRLDLFVTEACNLGCPYCFAATKPRRNPTDEDTIRAIDWLMLSRSPKVHVTLWGGEPLLRLELLKSTVRYAKERAKDAEKRITFSMPTNATKIDDDVIHWLEREGVQIFLSIDGDEEGQRTRPMKKGGSSHGLVQLGMKKAFEGLGPKRPAVRMTVTPDNAHRQGPSVRYFIEEGARELMIYAAFDQPWTAEEIETFEQGQREVGEVFVEMVRGSDDPKALPSFKAWKPILKRLLDGVPARRREGELRHCGAGGDLVALTVEGELAPCHRFVFYGREKRQEDVSLGDLENGVDAELSAPFSSLRVEEQRGKVRCVDCSIFDLCTYGCLAINYVTTGQLDHIPHAACDLMDAQVRVCREVHAELAGDPRYAVYLGRTVEQTFHTARRAIGKRAFAELLGG